MKKNGKQLDARYKQLVMKLSRTLRKLIETRRLVLQAMHPHWTKEQCAVAADLQTAVALVGVSLTLKHRAEAKLPADQQRSSKTRGPQPAQRNPRRNRTVDPGQQKQHTRKNKKH